MSMPKSAECNAVDHSLQCCTTGNVNIVLFYVKDT